MSVCCMVSCWAIQTVHALPCCIWHTIRYGTGRRRRGRHDILERTRVSRVSTAQHGNSQVATCWLSGRICAARKKRESAEHGSPVATASLVLAVALWLVVRYATQGLLYGRLTVSAPRPRPAVRILRDSCLFRSGQHGVYLPH